MKPNPQGTPKTRWQWYSPPQDSIRTTFCLNTTLHGLRYLGEEGRHICERLFWLTAFGLSVTISIVLIWTMWKDYASMPIVTVFFPVEMGLDDMPFPSVTICNVNLIQKSIYEKHVESAMKLRKLQANNSAHLEAYRASLAKIADMRQICSSALSTLDPFFEIPKYMKWLLKVEEEMERDKESIKKFSDPVGILRNASQPCGQMIKRCIWDYSESDCTNLFHPIETDYGSCCAFNTMPTSLLLRNSYARGTNPKVVEDWRRQNINYETLIFMDKTKDRKYPLRQTTAGRSAGLSLVLNANVSEYYCTNTDSVGFMMGVNVPLDFPGMKDTSIAIGTGTEVFVGVRPEVTMSDKSMMFFPMETRNCYLENEYALRYYTVYTMSNCLSECIAETTLRDCGCVRYYMPRGINDTVCSNDMYYCTEASHCKKIHVSRSGFKSVCSQCFPTCTEIDYQKEVTTLSLIDNKVEYFYHGYERKYTNRDVSVVHVYFNTDAVYPKIRKEVATTSQLISSAGGLLGLCLGFSILSLLEICYYSTIRICCNWYRDKTLNVKPGDEEVTFVPVKTSTGHDNRPIFPPRYQDRLPKYFADTDKGQDRYQYHA